MAKVYPSLFSFHLLGSTPRNQSKKVGNSLEVNKINNDSSEVIFPSGYKTKVTLEGQPLFKKQKCLLERIVNLHLFAPEVTSLNNILAHAAARLEKDQDNYDAQATISICN